MRGRRGHAAHVDGREGRRLGRDTAHRQAGRGAGAVDHRVAHCSNVECAMARYSADRACQAFARAFRRSRRHRRFSMSSTSIMSAAQRTARFVRIRFSRSAGCRSRCSKARRRAPWSIRSRSAIADTARLAHARAVGPGLSRPLAAAPCRTRRAPIIRARRGRGCSSPFVEAWLRVRGNTDETRREARTRFLDPLLLRISITRARSPFRNRRRRFAARARRHLCVAGVVARRIAARRAFACRGWIATSRKTAPTMCVPPPKPDARKLSCRRCALRICSPLLKVHVCIRWIVPTGSAGAVPQRASMGHRARGLQRGRYCVGLLSARPCAQPRIPLGRGRHCRFRRRHAELVRVACAVESQRPDPERAALRCHERAGQSAART